MEFELEKWDRLITSELHPATADVARLPEYVARSLELRDALRKQITEHMLSVTKQQAASLFIQHHQAVLIRLADTVTQFASTPKIKATTLSMYEEVCMHVQHVLEFIRSYFTRYFCLTLTAPAYYTEARTKEICSALPSCKKNLQAKGVHDANLLDIIFTAYDSLCKGERSFSYRELNYFDALLEELSSPGLLHKEGCVYARLTELLIQMNFNSQAFFNYVLGVIHQALSKVTVREEKIERLVLHRKEISMMVVRMHTALFHEAPTVQSVLIEAIDKELEYYRSLDAMVSMTEEGSVRYAGSNHEVRGVQTHMRSDHRQVTEGATMREVETRELMFVPFKGAEIYLLHKAFIDAGGAPGEIYKTLLERTAPFLSNKTQKGFSAESLCKYSDKVTPEVKDDVKRFLMKMIRNVDSYD